MKIQIKKIAIIAVVVLVVGTIVYSKISTANMMKKAALPGSTESKMISFEIKLGESVGVVAANLQKQGIISDNNLFTAYAKKMEVDKKIKAGVYLLNTKMSIKDILEVLVSGARTEVWITIPEGWRIDQIASYLEKQGLFKAQDFIDAAKVKNFSSTPFLSGLSGNTTLEGYLFPDTYKVYADAKPEDVIAVMLDNFGAKVTRQMMDQANQKGFTLHQFITLTSIVEKESAHSEDIRKIASVYYNRLEAGMLFQSDATITYITKRPDASPTIEETKIDSPYNTYLHKGLPPGPVGNPGLEAMQATLNPEQTDYLFFVSKGNRAYFAKTYEEHLANIAKYLN